MTNIKEIALAALEDLKGQDIVSLDVSALSDVMDSLVICTGTSNRQVKSLADNVVEEGKKAGVRPIGVEGMEQGDWVLVDYGDLVVHVMRAEVRSFYDLEKLWSMTPNTRDSADGNDPQRD
ncbi:ribosome silencing factor [Microbulbifer thermotolerans]|uniref:Ribosomal silencing factor RsfS n=1 Tax=Microbulbifer thermotolerans TaxID=252514 RepID=A0A143HJK1_MICTH|nr:ribosome silencing factor [Microbulbifer thermotolerans]AMX01904.1 ribosome silencing factor RsfS [Microbulbifer thermotolerans]MCX2779192.1 ribosome silencing factor [Microbulbifer thermotolerans]MCX2781705.1 ribosome silencing factor [Microbulbifer thermotolerans]MCX2793577.1 ribosome silencing factor [Microbulbifer thermotolerans]MCX2801553.1 ribosome silencing factor [Microbulbifer thermotolerans]